MTTHAQPIGVGDDADQSVSMTRLKLCAGIATAFITAVPATVLAFHAWTGSSDAGSTQPTTVTPTVIAGSPAGDIDDVSVDGSDVYVMGSARPDVDSVVVMIPGRKLGGNYWYNTAEVHDQRWSVMVTADPDLPSTFKAIVRYREGPAAVTGLAFREDATSTPPSPPPGVDGNCLTQNGDACFTQPGWGQASVSEVQR